MISEDLDRRPSDDELETDEGAGSGGDGGWSDRCFNGALIYPPAMLRTDHKRDRRARIAVAGESGGSLLHAYAKRRGPDCWRRSKKRSRWVAAVNTPVHIFHLKAAGQAELGQDAARDRQNPGSSRSEGQQVTADIYPYVNNGLGIAALIHPRHFGRRSVKAD